MAQKTVWDVISEIGRLGVIGFIALMAFVWAIVHWQSEPGTEIRFGFIIYTKPQSKSSDLERLYDEFFATGLRKYSQF